MPNLCHVHIKHEIEYGSSGFNWQINSLKSLLENADCSVNGELNDDGIGDWEIEERGFKSAVEAIKGMPAKKVSGFFSKDYVGNDAPEKFKEYVVSLLESFLTTGDHRDGYYHFSWY